MKTPRPPWLLVLAVLAAHLWLGHEVQRLQDGWARDADPPPPRMEVDFVREMSLEAPRPVARLAAPAAPPRRAPLVEAPGPAASQPAPEPAPDLAPSTPASAPEAATPPVMAASAAAVLTPGLAAASAPDATDEPGPEWPLSTRLTYVLTGNYRGPVHGQAQVEWLRQDARYQVHLDVSVGPSFAPLITRRMSSQGRLTPDGIAPERYDEETRVLVGSPRRASVFFLPSEVQLANGRREAAPRGAQDAASQFVQLTWLFLTGREPLYVGRQVSFPLVLPRRPYDWIYEVMGEEALATPMGSIATWRLQPRVTASGGDLTADVWLAPQLQFLPVRLVIRQDADTYIDLTLKSAPLQAAPESANDPSRRPTP